MILADGPSGLRLGLDGSSEAAAKPGTHGMNQRTPIFDNRDALNDRLIAEVETVSH